MVADDVDWSQLAAKKSRLPKVRHSRCQCLDQS